MQFESAAAERMFLESFHTQRVTQDRIFAVTQVRAFADTAYQTGLAGGGGRVSTVRPPPLLVQAAIALLLALRIPSNAIPAVRLLFWGTHAISATVLGLSSADKASYARLRPYLLSAARVFYNLLCPQLVWQLAAQSSAQGGSRDSWPGTHVGMSGLFWSCVVPSAQCCGDSGDTLSSSIDHLGLKKQPLPWIAANPGPLLACCEWHFDCRRPLALQPSSCCG